MSAEVVQSVPMLQLPTVPGKAPGIVGVDPYVVQCRDCGSTATSESIFALVVINGWQFHICDGPTGQRRCRSCLAAVIAACTKRRHD